MAVKNQKLKNAKTIPMRRRTKKGAIALIFVGILIIVVGGTVLALNLVNSNKKPDNQNNSSENTEVTNNNTITETTATNSSDTGDGKTPAKYAGEDPNTYNELTGTITFAGISENKFVVSAAIDQYITGNCRFEINGPDGSTISADIDIMAGPSSSFCSYSGPKPEAHGKYNINIVLTNNNKTGTITGEVEI